MAYPLPPAQSHLCCVHYSPQVWHVSQPDGLRAHHASFDVRVGGRQVRALFDTGATCSCMSQEFQQSLGMPMRPPEDATVSGVGGPTTVVGSLTVPVKVGKVQRPQEFVILTAPVASYPVLLGQDFLSAAQCTLQFTGTHVRLEVGKHPSGHPQVVLTRPCHRDSALVLLRHQVPPGYDVSVARAPVPPTVKTCGEDIIDSWAKFRRFQRQQRKSPALVYLAQVSPIVEVVDTDTRPPIPSIIQAVIDRHATADGTLRGDVPHNVTAHGASMDIRVLPHSRPTNVRQYRLTPLEQSTLVEKVQEFLARGWIEPSNSPWSSSVLFIPKPNGSLRFCVDYRFLNKVTIRDQGPLPSIPALLDSMRGARVFSALDLCSGFYQIPLSESSRDYTAFPTPLGQYRWRVMPMGLTNAPAVFQQAMNSVLRPHIVAGYCAVYIDDVLIKSSSLEEHARHLDAVLTSLQDARYFCQLPKCQFALSELRYLGFLVDGDGVRPDPKKVQSVAQWRPPTEHIARTRSADVYVSPADRRAAPQALASAVRSFLGFMTFFNRFIPRFASVAAPLYEQTRDYPPPWSESCDRAWAQLVQCLVTATYAYHPRFDSPFHVYTDASLRGVGGVIMQRAGDVLRPVAFCARKLQDAETRYSTTEQELLAVVHCFQQWRCYLEGSTVVLHTDHEPLTWLQSQKTLSRRQARWLEFLSQFNYSVLYVKGDENVVSDALSRRLQLPAGPSDLPGDTWPVPPSPPTHSLGALWSPGHWYLPCGGYFASRMVAMLHSDASGRLRQHTRASARGAASCGEECPAGEQSSTPAAPEGLPTPPVQSRPLYRSARPRARRRSSPPTRHRQDQKQSVTQGEPPAPDSNDRSGTVPEAFEPCGGYAGGSSPSTPLPQDASSAPAREVAAHPEGVLRGSQPDSLSAQADNLAAHEKLYDDLFTRLRSVLMHDRETSTDAQRAHLRLQERDGLLWRDNHRLYVPVGDQLRSDILWWHHDVPWAAHLGIQKTMSLLKRQFYWPGMQRDVDAYVASCHSCQVNKSDRRRRVPALSPLVPPESCWRTLGVDLIINLPTSASGHDAICVFMCHLSKMVRLVATHTTLSAQGFAKLFMLHIFPHYGFPVTIVSDRGTQWNSDFFKAICVAAGISLTLSTAYHPQTNGLVERTNEVVEAALRHYVAADLKDWDDYLPLVEFALNSSYHPSLGTTPYHMNRISIPISPFESVLQRRIIASPALASSMGTTAATLAGQRTFLQAREEFHRARRCVSAAKALMKDRHDQRIGNMPRYHERDLVWFSIRNLGLRHPSMRHKLLPKYWGPFTVLRLVGANAVELDLPQDMSIHPVVSTSLLKPYRPREGALPPPVVIRGALEWEVDAIVDHSIHVYKTGSKPPVVEFRVKWTGPYLDTWHEPCDFENAQDALSKYLLTRLTRSERVRVLKCFDAQSLARLPAQLRSAVRSS